MEDIISSKSAVLLDEGITSAVNSSCTVINIWFSNTSNLSTTVQVSVMIEGTVFRCLVVNKEIAAFLDLTNLLANAVHVYLWVIIRQVVNSYLLIFCRIALANSKLFASCRQVFSLNAFGGCHAGQQYSC
jgi:hypothetical protein